MGDLLDEIRTTYDTDPMMEDGIIYVEGQRPYIP
ncbi:unnamed protein product [Spirodela intermedia]|uniref:Uncharacterized protein n=1 Tax=Spirodela intermedia TaxID=51605 RepID=A0A7I8LGV8_SPIIN|nr:unnamed protein product [Spirodela intermedia]